MRETIEKQLQMTDPLAWMQASPSQREQWVDEAVANVEEIQADILQDMPAPTMTGNYLQDVATLNTQRLQAAELAMPTPPSESEQRQSARVFWTHWAKQNPSLVKPKVMALLTQWEEIFDTRPIHYLGLWQWEQNNPIYFEETMPESLREDSIIDDWQTWVQPKLEEYLEKQVPIHCFSPDLSRWNLMSEDLSLDHLRRVLGYMKEKDPLLNIAIEDIEAEIDKLAEQMQYELIDDPLPLWYHQYQQQHGNPA
ncbi:MAG: hypothetical protein Q4P06_08010 [Actinomycetaceae bacterium]|nr:hypothetical protein [Actinomycetaceae bacterium]